METNYNLYIFQEMVKVITMVEEYRRKQVGDLEISTLTETAKVMNDLGYKSQMGKAITKNILKNVISATRDLYPELNQFVKVDYDSMKKYSILDGVSPEKKSDSNDLELDKDDMKIFKSFETAKQNIKSSPELQESFDEISDIKLYGYLEKRVLKKKNIKKRNYAMSY